MLAQPTACWHRVQTIILADITLLGHALSFPHLYVSPLSTGQICSEQREVRLLDKRQPLQGLHVVAECVVIPNCEFTNPVTNILSSLPDDVIRQHQHLNPAQVSQTAVQVCLAIDADLV